MRQFFVVEVRRVVEHFLEPKEMARTRDHGVERALGRQHAGKLALVKGSKELGHHIERAIRHGDVLHVGDEIRRAASLGSQAHHFLAQVKPVGINVRHRAHGTCVVTLATANVEQVQRFARGRPALSRSFAHQLDHRIAQWRIVVAIQKVATAARLRLGIAHGVTTLRRAQQVQIALARTIEPMSARACSPTLVVHQRLMANGTQQHGNSLARTTQYPPLSHASPT